MYEDLNCNGNQPVVKQVNWVQRNIISISIIY